MLWIFTTFLTISNDLHFSYTWISMISLGTLGIVPLLAVPCRCHGWWLRCLPWFPMCVQSWPPTALHNIMAASEADHQFHHLFFVSYIDGWSGMSAISLQWGSHVRSSIQTYTLMGYTCLKYIVKLLWLFVYKSQQIHNTFTLFQDLCRIRNAKYGDINHITDM